ncbi:hypothetical protein LINGRAHAP2_LOCUS17603 [Linum grandiflorum]
MDFVSKSTVVVILLMGVLSTVVVDAKLPNKSIISGPDCYFRSDNVSYNKNVARLINIFVDGTKNVHRDHHHADYEYKQNYPNSDSGSVTGRATCDRQLWKLDCWSCLVTAKNKINDNCGRTENAEVKLKDCSIWFKKIE